MLGWIGTHSTFPYLESIFPVLSELAMDHSFRLKVVGAGATRSWFPAWKSRICPGVWSAKLADFQSIDIGLYPIDASLYSGNWAAGKSGFKAIQYMAVGVPYVATPVGGSAEIGDVERQRTFSLRATPSGRLALATLISDIELRQQMGAAGAAMSIENYGLPAQADKLAAALREAAVESRSS